MSNSIEVAAKELEKMRQQALAMDTIFQQVSTNMFITAPFFA